MTNKSIVIDFIILKKLGISIADYLFLVSLYIKKEHSNYNIKQLSEQNYIKLDDTNTPHLRQSSIDLINYLSIDSFKTYNEEKIIKKSKKRVNAEVNERINEYRSKWKDLKAGSMGDKHACIEKLSRWMITNPEYTFNDILKTADLYLSTEGANLIYLQRADYFIYKQDTNKIETSRLSAFIDDVNMITTKDWTSKIN